MTAAHRRPQQAAADVDQLARIEPLVSARAVHVAEPPPPVEAVALCESLGVVRQVRPHALVVLHAEVATGGWAVAAALHVAWERRAAGVVVRADIVDASCVALARRLDISLFLVSGDVLPVAMQLAVHVAAPEAARALRRAQCAERLAEQNTIRGVLSVLNADSRNVPVALVIADGLAAGKPAALEQLPGTRQVRTPVTVSDEQTWATLVARVPSTGPAAAHVEALLRLARPSLQAIWAATRLKSDSQAAREQAAFDLLRQLADGTDSRPAETPIRDHLGEQSDREVTAPAWSRELGWNVDGINRAVWIAPLARSGTPSPELTELVRSAWRATQTGLSLLVQADGWISWHSSAESDDRAAVRKALRAFGSAARSLGLVAGVGGAHRGVSGLMRSVAEARLAAYTARDEAVRHEGAPLAHWFDEVGPRAALAWLPVSELAEVAALCLPELVGAKDRLALAATCLAVLDCGGSLSQASDRLGVHRNTVLARVNRARQLGVTFDEPGDRLALHALCYALVTAYPGDVVEQHTP